MSITSSLIDLQCKICPFLKCDERDTCYDCYCYLDRSLLLDRNCQELTHHSDCPLLKGQIIIIKEDEGKLSIGIGYQ